MAMIRTARAKIVNHSLEAEDWNAIRNNGKSKCASKDFASTEFSPDKFLLTHCTIIASVDVEAEPVNDKGWGYVVTADTEKYINSNDDAWERALLLLTYKSFQGAENYVEHIQIPELSKGKIVDAVARDLGDTIYVDILVATDLKHKELVQDIKDEKITTLSMGCTVEYTICSKCGNVAEDDTQMCTHIKYMKGNHYFDSNGKRRKIAELCGHKEDEDSVSFIEASWVGNPAFKGAVLRSILKAEEVEESKIKAAFETTRIIEESAVLKAASSSKLHSAIGTVQSFIDRAAAFNFDEEEEGAEGEEEAKPEKEEASPIDDITEDMKQVIRNQVKTDLRDELNGGKKEDQGSEDMNDNLVQSSENLVRSNFAFSSFKSRYAAYGNDLMLYRLYEGLVSIKSGGWKELKAKGFTGRDVLALSYFIDSARNETTLSKVAYAAIAKVGGTDPFENPIDYLRAVGKVAGIHKIPADVAKQLIYKGNLYNQGSK